MNDFRRLLLLSRPRTWLVTGLPFAVAAVDAQRGVTVAIVLGVIYFLGPYNLLRYGLQEIGDPATADPDATRRMQIAIAATNLPFLVLIVLLSGAAAGLGLSIAVAAAIAAVAPPLRTSARPFLDIVTGALLLVLPAVAGFLVGGSAIVGLPWIAILAFAGWSVAVSALRSIDDLATDREAGRASTGTALGARTTSLIALTGFVIAAALAATHGPIGALAALGLDLYLLLPAMVLFARRGDTAAEEAAGRRAWAGSIGLDYLVGGWLAFLALRHWAVAGFTSWEIAIGLAAAAAGYALCNVLAIRVATRRRRPTRASHPDAVAVAALTIVVPCRDDAWRLPACLESLLDQTYADTTILVVDDGSTDGTAEVAAEVLGGAGKVVVAPPAPAAWARQGWARHIGAEASSGDLVLFVDPDMRLVPVAVRLLVEQLEARRLDLLSGLPRYAMPTRGERMAVPGFAMLLFGFVPIWLNGLIRGRVARAAFAYGPFLLVRREAYLATGGHAATPGSLRDDIDLARTFVRARHRVGSVHAPDLAARRRDPGSDPAIAAWRRILLPSVGGSLAIAIGTVLLEALAFLVPLLLPVLALLTGAGPRMLVVSFVPLLILGAMRVALTLTQRQPLTTILWHPVTIGLTLIGQLAAIVDHVTGRPPRGRGRDT